MELTGVGLCSVLSHKSGFANIHKFSIKRSLLGSKQTSHMMAEQVAGTEVASTV